MNSDMKCPFCQQEMICGGTICHYNPDCPIHDNPVPTEILELLERAHKALDVAVDGLLAVWRATDCTTKQGSIAYNVLRDLNIKPLDRIKALEQKD